MPDVPAHHQIFGFRHMLAWYPIEAELPKFSSSFPFEEQEKNKTMWPLEMVEDKTRQKGGMGGGLGGEPKGREKVHLKQAHIVHECDGTHVRWQWDHDLIINLK